MAKTNRDPVELFRLRRVMSRWLDRHAPRVPSDARRVDRIIDVLAGRLHEAQAAAAALDAGRLSGAGRRSPLTASDPQV